MAITGTYVYEPTIAQVVTEALRKLGVLEEGASASATQVTDATPAFEMLVKAYQAHGLLLWKVADESVTLVASTAEYTIDTSASNKALKILDCVFRDSDGYDTTMYPLTRQEYMALPDKDQTGSQPTQYYFDPQRLTSTITVWPVPDATAATGTIELKYQATVSDIGSTSSKHIDFPSEWIRAVALGLAYDLSWSYGKDLQERFLLRKDAEQALDLVLSWDTEQESVYLKPDNKHG